MTSRRRLLQTGIGALAGALWNVPARADAIAGNLGEAVRTGFPAAQEAVWILGRTRAGDGGEALYRRVAAEPPHGGKFPSADGAWWEYVPDARGANARAFGCIADGALGADRGFSGTDNAGPLQAAIDYAAYFGRCRIYLKAGVYRIGRGLHLGYGAGAFDSVILEGDGPKYRGESRFSGTAICCDFSDQPGLAVQGARATRISDLSLIGRNFDWIESRRLGALNPALDDIAIANWIDPALNPNANARHTPYAAIAIDPYSGPRPPVHYPDVAYPAFLGPVAQYGKNFSSGVEFENVAIAGFVAALAIQPCDADGNGDFVKFRNCSGEMCATIVSAGNTQGRLLGMDQCRWSQFHSGIVNTVHGRQGGKLGLLSLNTNWDSAIQILDVRAPSYAGPCVFAGGYGEGLWRIGDWGLGYIGSSSPLSFAGFEFHFTGQNEIRGVPLTVMTAAAPASVSFRDCSFVNFTSVLTLSGGAGYAIDNCFSQVNGRPLSRPTPYERFAHNFLGGGIMFAVTTTDDNIPPLFNLRVTQRFDLDGRSAPLAARFDEYCVSSRALGLCAWSRHAVPRQSPETSFPAPRRWTALAKNDPGIDTASLDGGVLNLRFRERSEQLFAAAGPLPGDVIWDDASGAVFFVRSRAGNTVQAILQNGYRRSAAAPLFGFLPRAGNFYFGNARFYTPAEVTYGDLAPNSAAIANAGRADGYGAYLADEVRAGDWLVLQGPDDALVAPAGRLVRRVTDGPRATITLGANATESRRRQPLRLFLRLPAENP